MISNKSHLTDISSRMKVTTRSHKVSDRLEIILRGVGDSVEVSP